MNNYVKYIILFVFVLVLQYIFLNSFIIYNYAFCLIYIAFILLIPYEIPSIILLLLGFLVGISVDIMSDMIGLNTAASVLTAFLRPFLLKRITPKGGYDLNFNFSIRKTGISWFLIYSTSLIFIHIFVLFLLDASDFSLILNVLLRTIFSTILTVFVLTIGVFLFQSSKTK